MPPFPISEQPSDVEIKVLDQPLQPAGGPCKGPVGGKVVNPSFATPTPNFNTRGAGGRSGGRGRGHRGQRRDRRGASQQVVTEERHISELHFTAMNWIRPV